MNKALDILQEWIKGINTADIDKLLNLYNEKAVLIPTFSNRLLDSNNKIKDYFEKLASKERLSIELHRNTILVQEIRKDLFSLSGIYKWQFAIDGELFSFEARFSYIFDLNSKNPIIHHHSSQIPRTL